MTRKNAIRRTKKIFTYLSPEEHEKIRKEYKATTCRSFSEFFRNRLTGQPETVFYRNKSADDFLPIAIGLKTQLNIAITQFISATEIVNSIRHIPELCLSVYALEAKMFSLEQTIEEIKSTMNQIYEYLWSQK
jgi:hypothetical protein